MDDRARGLALDAEAVDALGQAALASLLRLHGRSDDEPIFRADPDGLIEELLLPPPEAPEALADVLATFELAAGGGWDKGAPGNLAYIPNGGLESGVVAAMLGAGTRRFTGAAYETPGLVALEEGVVRWMAAVVGLPSGAAGILLSGGSIANLVAVAAARGRLGGDPATGTVYIGAGAHHSVAKGARLAGVRSEQVRIVPTDDERRMDVVTLARMIAEDRAAGRRPCLVVATAGTTDDGTIDDLHGIASVAREAGAWFHVDAAYGGFFALTSRGRDRLVGMGEADSVTVDAHKGLFLPYGIGALLVRDRATLTAANVEHGAYMRALPSVDGLPHYFELGPELTRPFRGLIAWLPLHLHGVAAFRETLDRMLDLAERAAGALGGVPGVRVFGRPPLSIVTVGASAGDDATRRLLDAINDSGRFQVSGTTIDGRLAVRLAFLSQRTTGREVDEVVALIAQTAAG